MTTSSAGVKGGEARVADAVQAGMARLRRRRARLLSGTALALGTWAIGHVMAPGAAQAQCSSSSNPAPPPPVQSTYSNQSFGGPPLTLLYQASNGLVGCNGPGDKDDGSPGQPGGSIGVVGTGLTIQGVPSLGPSTIGAGFSSQGGAGGYGHAGGTYEGGIGGNGGAAGNGGPVTVRLDGNFVPEGPYSVLNAYGITAYAGGGSGGGGGAAPRGGTINSNNVGGIGSPGGSGGTVSLNVSGAIRAYVYGVQAFVSGGSGGNGGEAPTGIAGNQVQGGNGGNGGSGGTAVVRLLSGTVTTNAQGAPINDVAVGIWARADGGNAGAGGSTGSGIGEQGGNGGVGGAGGSASVVVDGGASVAVSASASASGSGNGAVVATSNGGSGGTGGTPGGIAGQGGGNGGAGGSGGSASATILGTVTYDGPTGAGVLNPPAVYVASNGGSGSTGGGTGGIGTPGGGGYAGAGGGASLTLGQGTTVGSMRTSGDFAHGALVQSVGGGGGNGGNARYGGGAGAAGGDGGPVTVEAPAASVVVTGQNSAAVLAQSVGGGGGSGGDATDIAIGVGYAIGGNGGLGGNGGAVQVNLGNSVFASTSALGGAGILAQSIGGSGGNGGSASSTGGGFFSLVVGGDAGGGGSGGKVTVNTGGLVTTYGDHATGIQAQSIGGGGGKGGSALSFIVDLGPAAAVSVGGRGGGGGPAGNVTITNTGQVTTYGADAYGVLMQSVGGGGGAGGAAAARAVSLSPDKRIPAVSLAVALGGAGGAGNTGGTVGLTNSGLITTAGDGAIGVMAQSIGGGGGSGGDSTAASYSNGPQGGVSISVAVAVGGTGGSGGTGGPVNLANSGLVATLGQDAYGVFAQSVGGGGGTGGGGDATASANGAKRTFGVSVAVGATGGTGGDAGTVTVGNSGAVTTRGDGADGVFAQSVGGGGGAAGGGTATANGGQLSAAVSVGGSGGAGGNGNTATVTNSGSIVTRGTDAIGLSVQSVGGGGGKAGKGGATAGGTNPESSANSLFGILSKGLNFNQQVTDLGNGILRIGLYGREVQASLDQLAGIFSQPQAGQPSIGAATQINVSVSVGGSGGAAGDGGAAAATNTGSIVTYGAQSDGIYAQSVGGGGGSGGAASSTGKAASDTPSQASVAVGGRGGAGGNGGPVTVTNGAGGTILTQGVAAFGIMAQSAGGGGGEGSLAGTVDGSLASLGVGLGGSGGRGGDGGTVTVSTGDRSTGSAIETTGKHGIGIYAQSVGGGGGLVRTMTTDETFDPSKILDNPQGRLGDVHGLSLTLGGQDGIGGRGGEVQVSLNGRIRTSGLDAHGILAQSVGGGGGLAVGGQLIVSSVKVPGTGSLLGNGGPVTVTLQNNGQIITGGNGAYGILAQSIGGGGGIGGDLSAVSNYNSSPSAFGMNYVARSGVGDGGSVNVGLNTASVLTTGNHAPGIFAQSVGGGGGLASFSIPDLPLANQLTHGTAGGFGSGGALTVTLVDSSVTATGAGSAGILAQSDGTSRGVISVSIGDKSSVSGGTPDPNVPSGQAAQSDAAAIRLLGGAANQIDIAGTVTGLGGGYAILTDTPQGNTTVTIRSTGIVNGDMVFSSGAGNVVDNRAGGVLNAPTTINLNGGVLRNAGTLHVGGIGTVGRTTVTGDLVQSSTGTIVVDVAPGAPGASAADQLQVNGRAILAGTVVPVVAAGTRLRPGVMQAGVVTATGGVVLDGVRVSLAGTPVVRYDLAAPDANTLALSYAVDYAGTRTLREQDLASPNRGAVGRALNAILSGDAGAFGPLADRLAALPTAQALAATLDAFSGEAAASVQQTAFAGQQAYTATVLRHVVGEERATPGPAPYKVAALEPVAGPPDNAHGMRVWVGGFGGSERLDGSDGQGSLHTTAAGGLIGLDKWFDRDRMAGISVGGGGTDFSVAGRASQGHGTSVNVSAYGLARFGSSAYVSGIVAYGNYATDLKRTGLGGATGLSASSRGSVTDDVFRGKVEVGWRQTLGRVVVTPFASLGVDHLWQSGFTETATSSDAAGALALRFKREERTSVPLTLGGRVGSAFQLGGERVLGLSAELGWVHEFNPQRSVTAAFVAAPAAPFRVLGVSASRDAAQLGLDAKLSVTRNVALLGSFTGRFSGVESAVGGFGGLQVTW